MMEPWRKKAEGTGPAWWWPIITVAILLWSVARGAWDFEDRFITRREFQSLESKVDAIADRLGVGVPGLDGQR